MFCKKCGKEIVNDAKFCPNCGAELQQKYDEFFDDTVVRQEQVYQQTKQKKRKKPSILGIVGFGLTMFSSIFFFYTFIFTLASSPELVEAVIIMGVMTLLLSTPGLILSIIGLIQTNRDNLNLRGFPLSGTIVSACFIFFTIIYMACV